MEKGVSVGSLTAGLEKIAQHFSDFRFGSESAGPACQRPRQFNSWKAAELFASQGTSAWGQRDGHRTTSPHVGYLDGAIR